MNEIQVIVAIWSFIAIGTLFSLVIAKLEEEV